MTNDYTSRVYDYNLDMVVRYSIILILALTLSGHSQATKSPSAVVPSRERGLTFNFPRTPLEISTDGERGYDLNSKTKTPINRFRLGCVHEQGKNLQIVHRLIPEDAKIAPDEKRVTLGFHHNPAKTCEQWNGKLAVIEVDFEDGTQWRATAKVQEN